MSAVDVRKYVGHIGGRQSQITSERALIATRREEHKARRPALVARSAEVERELELTLLPDLEPATCARAGRLLAFRSFEESPPKAQIEAERVALTQLIAEVEAMPAIRDREILRAPDSGVLTQELADLRSHREPLVSIVERCTSHPRFQRLLEARYDTEGYAVPYWRLAYYQDWKAGDEVVERFPDQARFDDVRGVYLDATENLGAISARISALETELAAGEALDRQLSDARSQLATVAARHLADARQRLVRHVRALGLDGLAGRLDGAPDVATLVAALDGIDHQIKYLDEIDRELGRLDTDLLTESQKLTREATKYSRPKYVGLTFASEDVSKRFRERPSKVQTRLSRLGEAQTSVVRFDSWDRGQFVRDFLWWDVMTDGRLDGNFISEVREFRDEHPGYSYDSDDDDHLAAASMAHSHFDSSPTTSFDAS
jgi:hypothetical protein